MSISRASKLNSVATQLHKKPMDCGYGGKTYKQSFEQSLVDAEKIEKYNDEITEVLREIPNHEAYSLLRNVFIDLGIRKES